MEVSCEREVEELVAIGFARATDFLSIQEGCPVLKDPEDPAAGAAIATLETGPKGVKVKFYDKLKALELLGKHLGMFAGTGTEPEGNNLLDAILDATREEVQTHDLPEVQPAAAAGHDLVEPAEIQGT